MILHIGLGKTGTTSLQMNVFPALQQMGVISVFNPVNLMTALWVYELIDGEETYLKDALARLPANALISLETLSGWNPATWHSNVSRLARIFPAETRIVITLRDPESWLCSVYLQMIKQGIVVKPEHFFLTAQQYTLLGPLVRDVLCEKFNVDALDYSHLVELYAGIFSEVTVIPVAGLAQLQFVQPVFGVSEEIRLELVERLALARSENVSYSARAVRLTLLREKIFRRMGARTANNHDSALQNAVLYARGDREQSLKDSRTKVDIMPAKASGRREWFRWRHLMQEVLDRRFPSARYTLPAHVPRGVSFQQNLEYYQQLCNNGFIRITRPAED